MATIKEIIGANIKAQRKRVKLSQEELGERVGLTYTTIGLIERGASWPQYENLAAIAKALGCDERVLIATAPVPVVNQGISPELLKIIATADEDEMALLKNAAADIEEVRNSSSIRKSQ